MGVCCGLLSTESPTVNQQNKCMMAARVRDEEELVDAMQSYFASPL